MLNMRRAVIYYGSNDETTKTTKRADVTLHTLTE